MNNCNYCNKQLIRKKREGINTFQKRILCDKECRRIYQTGIMNPFYGKKHSQGNNKINSIKHLKENLSKKQREKQSLSHIGQKPWNKGKKIKSNPLHKINIPINIISNHLKNITKYYGEVGKIEFKQKLKKRKVCGVSTLHNILKKNKINLDHIAQLVGVKFKPIERNIVCIGVNETKILNRYEEITNTKLERQYEVQQGKYFIDGYDPIHKIAVEIDEKHHLTQLNKNNDIIRQKNIEDILGCKFIRIKDY